MISQMKRLASVSVDDVAMARKDIKANNKEIEKVTADIAKVEQQMDELRIKVAACDDDATLELLWDKLSSRVKNKYGNSTDVYFEYLNSKLSSMEEQIKVLEEKQKELRVKEQSLIDKDVVLQKRLDDAQMSK